MLLMQKEKVYSVNSGYILYQSFIYSDNLKNRWSWNDVLNYLPPFILLCPSGYNDFLDICICLSPEYV